MRLRTHLRYLPASVASLVLAVGAVRVSAQVAGWGLEQEDPLWMEMLPRLRYIKVDAEAEQKNYTFKVPGGGSAENQRLYVAPGVGLGWNNFIYHPDLFTYSILAEPGYSWQKVSGTGYANNQETLLLNGLLTGVLLQEKPYSSTISYARSHDDVQYNFFNSAVTDAETLNILTGYREGPVPVAVTFQKSDSDSVGYNQETLMDQYTLGIHARNERKKLDATDLNYQFGQLNYRNNYGVSSSSSDNSYHHVTLTDTEHFKKSSLSSSILFYEIDSSHSSSENVNAALGYNYVFTPHLQNYYNYSLQQYSGNGSDSLGHNVSAGLTHQLYDSLASGVNMHGSTLNSSSAGSTLDSVSYGAGASLDYNKHLGNWATLSLGNSAGYDITDQQVSGSALFIADEGYNVPTTGPMIIRLKLPREISITSVKKNNVDLAASEWQAIMTSDPWQIEFFSGGPNNIQPGDAVTVSYTVMSNPSGTFSTLTDNTHFGLLFWHGQAEIYANYNFTENHANSADFLLQNVQQFDTGVRLDRGGFRFQGSYSDQHSTLYDFQSVTLSEAYSTPLTLHSSAGIDLSQQWNIYPPGSGTSTNQTQTASFYNFMAHYEWHPTSELSWSVEAGYQRQSGTGYDQDLFTVRTYLNWMVGKLEFRLGYEHDNQEYTLEKRERDYVFLRLRRNF